MVQTVIARQQERARRVPGDAQLIRPSNTTTYTAGDALAAVTTNNHVQFDNVTRRGTRHGLIVGASCHITSYVATGPAIDLMLFYADVGEDVDNAAATITDAEMLTFLGTIAFLTGGWIPGNATAGAGGNQSQVLEDLNIRFTAGGVGINRNLYGFPIMRNAYVPVSAEGYTFAIHVRDE